MRTSRLIPAVWLFVALAAAAVGQTTQAEQVSGKVDAFVTSELRVQHVPGVALGVMREARLVKAAGYGMANVELGVAAKPESIFQTGSVGKQFTATAVMMLVEEGKARSGCVRKILVDPLSAICLRTLQEFPITHPKRRAAPSVCIPITPKRNWSGKSPGCLSIFSPEKTGATATRDTCFWVS